MESVSSFSALFLVAVVVIAVTASCMVAVTIGGIRSNRGAWELFGELVVVSVLVPTGLIYTATLLPPELFEFLP